MFRYRFSLLIAIFLLLSGCLRQGAPIEGSATGALSPDQTPSATAGLPTTQSTSTLAPTPAPTLNNDQKLAELSSLYDTDGSCKLPCWWGIRPGLTTWDEASRRLAPLGHVTPWSSASGGTYYDFALPQKPAGPVVSEQLAVGFAVQAGIVEGMGLNSYWLSRPPRYALYQLLGDFGKPDEIWLRTTPVSIDGIPGFDLVLYYRHEGMISISGDASSLEQHKLQICPQYLPGKNYDPAGVVLWSEAANISFQGLRRSTVRVFVGIDPSEFRKIEDLSASMSTDTFYQSYLDPNTHACLRVDY